MQHKKILVFLLACCLLISASLFIYSTNSNIEKSTVINNDVIKTKFSILRGNNTIDSQTKFFQKHSNNKVTMIISVSSGYLSFFKNLVCSIQKVDPSMFDYIVIWAMDSQVEQALDKISETIPELKKVGIYAEEQFMSGLISKPTKKQFYEIMALRPLFFVHLLENIKMGFVFADSDVVFNRNPWQVITANNGLGQEKFNGNTVIGKEWKPSSQGVFRYLAHLWTGDQFYKPDDYKKFDEQYDKAMELAKDPLLNVEPDVVYSMDPRKAHPFLDDPYEGGSFVPKICGGLFYAKPTGNSITLYKKLHEAMLEGFNDQDGVDYIFEKIMPVQIVGQLPRCIPRTKHAKPFCPEKGVVEQHTNFTANPDALKIRLLDIYQFYNPAILTDLVYDHATPSFMDATSVHEYHRLVHDPHFSKNPAVPSKLPIMFHPNIASNPFRSSFEVKTKELDQYGMWYLNEKEICII
ncbi:hypothetical protein HDV04_005184 [Boothiomyces sp. JEL0838]|nr:hypothetical protein HDV04_005184 [Boothiomyces sp. JEL0838]